MSTVPNFDFLAQRSALPRPVVTAADAQAIALERFGVHGTPTELGSQQDRNFRIDAPSGRFVLKVANPVFAADELAAQNLAMGALHDRGVIAPRALPGLDGSDLQRVDLGGQRLIARLLTYVDGDPLTGEGDLSDAQLRALGDIAGRVAAGLAGLEHTGTERSTQWDLRIAGEVVEQLAGHVAEPARRRLIEETTQTALARLAPLRAALRTGVIHGDVTDDNIVIAGDDADAPAGVIDFGDVSRGWIVAELAVAVASALHHVPGDPLRALETIDAFAAHLPLTDPEIEALWPLVLLRAAVLVVSGEQQVAVDAGNAYADENRAHEWLVFAVARRVDPDEVESLIRWRLQRATATPAAAPDRLFDLTFDGDGILDLSVTSHRLDDGRWLEPDIEDRLLAETRHSNGRAATRYGEFRLTRAVLESAAPTPTFALAVTARVPEGTRVHAPVSGMLAPSGNEWVLSGSGLEVWFDGLAPFEATARPVAAGDPIGVTETLSVQLSRLTGHRPPAFVRPGAERSWRALSPDPSSLFGVALAAPEADPDALLERRDASFARVQEHYYAHPPQIERGWRHHLVDTRAQTYVDMVNNVTAVGHAHPRLVRAVRDQWALLNTNSRFHYEELSDFTSRLADLAPGPLDTVFLVNSGSEAVDLAIRLAQTFTGQRTIVAVREAYHGWTVGADAVSSSIGDNPRALETRPDWVRLVESPHGYRGKYRGPDAAAGYLADFATQLAALDDSGLDDSGLDEAGTGLAGFIAEPVFGNAGGVMLPDGYLAGAFQLVRERGGVCIADEVQVGYGRLGAFFWGCEQQGVVPDIITVAKAMGNGHPLGAVITTREIAERFAAEGSFFSSAGGSPVSARVGLTVLDIMRDEQLQENARVVGAYLTARLEELAGRFPIIGAVHGLGLYLGVELVRDPVTLEPAGAEAARICDALLAEGCVVQPTGDYKNVLKIKPPLCLTIEAADFFADALERVLPGWL